jgi:hypothetical protein
MMKDMLLVQNQCMGRKDFLIAALGTCWVRTAGSALEGAITTGLPAAKFRLM